MKKIYPFSFYVLMFGAMASFRPFLVLYYQSLSFTGAQIGLLTGLAPLITVVCLPFITGIADRTNRHRLVMSLSLLLMVSGLILFPLLKSFILVFGIAIMTAVVFAPVMPLSASAAMVMLKNRKDLYGRIRLGGTIGYSIAATAAGTLVQNTSLRIAFWSAAVLLFIAFLISQKLVHSDEEEIDKTADMGQARELLKNPHFLLFLLIGLSGGIAFATLNSYFFPYMKELGANEQTMGLALTVGTIAEIPILFYVSYFIKRFGAYTIVMFAIAMTALRFLLLGIAPNANMVLFVQLLNGFNYPLLTVAGVTYTDEQAPVGLRATAQGLFNIASGGIGAAIGGFLGGPLIESIGANHMYLGFGFMVAFVVIFVSLMRRILPPEKVREPLTHLA